MTPYQGAVLGMRLAGSFAIFFALVLLISGGIIMRLAPGFSYDPAMYYMHLDNNYYTVITYFPWLAFGSVSASLGLVAYMLSKLVGRLIARDLGDAE